MNFDVLFSKNMLEKWFGQGDVGWIWHNFLCQCLLVVHLSISLVSGAWHVGAKQIYATGISFLMNYLDQRNQQYGLSSDKRLLKYMSLSYNLIFKITTIVYYIHLHFVILWSTFIQWWTIFFVSFFLQKIAYVWYVVFSCRIYNHSTHKNMMTNGWQYFLLKGNKVDVIYCTWI